MRISTSFDEQLREQALCADPLEEAIASGRDDLATLREKLRKSPNELDRTRLARVLNRLSDHLRLADQLDDALAYSDEAIEIWRSFGRERAAYLAQLRRAKILFRSSRGTEGLSEANALVEQADAPPFEIYRDFALQLRGRIHAGEHDFGAAVADLEEALEIRRRRGRQRLVERTERLLELVREGM